MWGWGVEFVVGSYFFSLVGCVLGEVPHADLCVVEKWLDRGGLGLMGIRKEWDRGGKEGGGSVGWEEGSRV